MQPTFTVIRAIGAEFAFRTMRPIIIIIALMNIILLVLGGWLTTQNAWWWILQSLFIIGTVIFIALVVVVYFLLRALRPTLTKTQKRSVRQFVDKLERVAEHLQTPQPILVFYAVKDTIWPKHGGFIETISEDSRTLGSDFSKLRREFK